MERIDSLLFQKFKEHFKTMDKRVREEDIILFLDKKSNSKFDRETFNELIDRMESQNITLTPFNFQKTYFLAHDVLKTK